jgi:hypothetical protein
MNLFIVESPFQLISAIEANFYFKDKSIFIIKYNKNKKNIQQIKQLIKFFKLKNFIEIEPIFSNFEADIRLLILLKKLKNYSFNKIFIGEYRSFHMRKFFDFFANADKYCLDDGNVSFEIAKLIQNRQDQYYYNSFKGKLKKIIYSVQSAIFNLNLPIRRDIKLFTCFDIPCKIEYIKHNFEFLKKNYLKDINYKNIVYFYGSNLSELNVPINKEINFLKYILNYYKHKNLEIFYIPHRNENKEKIKLIKKIGFQIKTNTYPAEIQILIDKIAPLHIASFTSSVLLTLPILYNFKSVTSFKIDLNLITSKYKNEIKTVYTHYSNKVNIEYIKD